MASAFHSASENAALKPEDVRGYLLEHPDFFGDNGDILSEIVPPEQRRGDGVEDFQRYMLTRLQGHLSSIRGENDDLTQLMQEHLQCQNRINAAVLALLDAKDFESTLAFISNDMANVLDNEAVALFVESGGLLATGNYGGAMVVEDGFVEKWMDGRDVRLDEQPSPEPDLFGEAAGAVNSRALARLCFSDGGAPYGMLALGHCDPSRYATCIATEQVEFLSAVVERCLRKWLGNP